MPSPSGKDRLAIAALERPGPESCFGWRRRRDSNARGSYQPPNRLAGGCFRPLSHVSGPIVVEGDRALRPTRAGAADAPDAEGSSGPAGSGPGLSPIQEPGQVGPPVLGDVGVGQTPDLGPAHPIPLERLASLVGQEPGALHLGGLGAGDGRGRPSRPSSGPPAARVGASRRQPSSPLFPPPPCRTRRPGLAPGAPGQVIRARSARGPGRYLPVRGAGRTLIVPPRPGASSASKRARPRRRQTSISTNLAAGHLSGVPPTAHDRITHG
jgi:hypothetical protein